MANNNMNLQQLFQVIISRLGLETGKKIQTEINKLIELEHVDVNEIRSMIKTIQSILDADPNTEKFDVAQNIIKTITNLRNQIEQNTKRISNLETEVNNLKGSSNKQVEKNTQDIAELQKNKVDKNYADSNFVGKSEITNINIDSIINVYVNCLEEGIKNPNATVADCQSATNSTKDNTPTQKTTNTNTNATSSSATGSSDGGVI